MKLVQNLPEIFEEFGEKKREAFLENCPNIRTVRNRTPFNLETL